MIILPFYTTYIVIYSFICSKCFYTLCSSITIFKMHLFYAVSFHLNAHVNPDCVSGQNCTGADIVWDDGGDPMDTSLYDSWLPINIDENKPCVIVSLFNCI